MIKLCWSYAGRVIKKKANQIKTYYSRLIHYMRSYVNEPEVSGLPYEDLAPKDDADGSNFYSEALDWAIKNDKVYNIALTGTYGSGKSSVLRTYEKNRPHYHYLNISLASFYEKKETAESDTSQNDDPKNEKVGNFEDAEIEKSILQQLFYKVHPSQIPYTRFRKIENCKMWTIFIKVIIVLITILLGIILFYPSGINKIQNNVDEVRQFFMPEWVYGVFILLAVSEITCIIKYCNARLRLSKVTFEKTAVELNKANDESIFNKYLEEILYFFEVTKYNVVFIEDLDRFNSTKIFTKLRELNALINNSEQINRRVVFLYAIKDDMFKKRERTKFFDFIIPIIPVVNATNSGDKLLEKIRQNNLGEKISNEYIKGVSLYIDDMRILNNIYNEFVLYKNILTNVSLKAQQILSLIIYKNLYPNDFADLQYNKGIVYRAFENKKTFIEEKTKEIYEERIKLEEKLERTNQEVLATARELKAAFLYGLFGMVENRGRIQIDYYTVYPIDQIMQDDFDLSLLDKEGVTTITFINDNGARVQGSIKTTNEQSGSQITYVQRLKDIKVKNKEKQEQIKDQIQLMKNQERTLCTYNLKSLIREFGVKNILEDVMYQEKVIVYLLRNGYIDETYPNYLTYFYENSISALDMNFIFGIRNHESCGFEYSLSNIKEVISRLNDYEFEQIEVLNFALLDYFFENNYIKDKNFCTIMKQLSNEASISIQFIDHFIRRSQYVPEFLNVLCANWHNIWGHIESDLQKSALTKDFYLQKIIAYVDLEGIAVINRDGMLKHYIENKGNFFDLMASYNNDEKIKKVISKLNIQFKMLEASNADKELFDFVFENDNYSINPKMIETILRIKSPQHVISLSRSNFTAIKKANYRPLLHYIEHFFSKYLENVFLFLENNTEEELEVIIEILNKENLSADLKEKIIEKEQFALIDITVVPKKLWVSIFKKCKLEFCWDNVFRYFKMINQIDIVLVEFLSRKEVYFNLSSNKFIAGKNEEEKKICLSFIEQFINSTIPHDAFENLAKSIPYIYTDYPIDELAPQKVDVLIERGILKFTVGIYSRLKEKFSGKHIKFIEKHHNAYLEEQEKYPVDNDDLNAIFDLTCFTENQKLQVISKVNIENITDELVRKIYLIILGATEKIKLSTEFFDKVWSTLPKNNRLKFLITQIETLKKSVITDCLNSLGAPYAMITASRQKHKIDFSEDVLELAKELKKLKYISSYVELEEEGTRKAKKIQFNTKSKV